MVAITRLYVVQRRHDVAETTETDMTYEPKKILIIENATQDGGEFCARAFIFQNDLDTDALSVLDIFESENIDVLRDMIKAQHEITHFKSNSRNFDGSTYRVGGWSDALRVAKETAYDLAIEERADVRKNMSLRHLVEYKVAAIAARTERQRLVDLRDSEKAKRAADRAAVAAERVDFDAWSAMTRAARADDSNGYALTVTMRWAYNEVASYPEKLAAHVAQLQTNPVYALEWSGDFFQSAASFEVACHLVNLFEAGIAFDDMKDEIMTALFNKGGYATSRSTSVMSNLMDDCTRVAWTSAAQRISGKTYW